MSQYGKCTECSLSTDRYVPGHGCEDHPDICFVGEAPGAEEVERGEPFVGRSGKLLRECLSGLGMDTSRIYYANACCCRPPGNRAPKADEIHACHDRLMHEIASVAPRVVVALGNSSLTSLLGGGTGITKRRGIYQEIDLPDGTRVGVIPTLHPAGILREPDGFRDLVDDIDFARQVAREGKCPIVEPPYHEFVMVRTPRMFQALLKKLEDGGRVAIDLETAGLDPRQGHILSIAFSWGDHSAWSVDWMTLLHNSPENRLALREVLDGCEGVYHNSQFDVQWLQHNGYDPGIVFDTMLASYCCDERQGSHGLKRLATQHFQAPEYDLMVKTVDEDGRKASLGFTVEEWLSDPKKTERIMKYNATDAYYTFLLMDLYTQKMEEDGVTSVHDDILIPAARHFIRLEREGMLVDEEYLHKLGAEWRAEIEEIGQRLLAFPGAEELNLRSTKQVSDFLFGTLGLKTMDHDADGVVDHKTVSREISGIEDEEAQEFWRTSQFKGGTKARSTGTYMLYWLAQQHEFPRLLVRHRILTKQYGAYYDGYLKLMDDTGRIRPRYRLHGTRTGRLSSTDPNIHGMPRRKAIKRIFVADPGYTLVSADYSQAEIRMVAHLAGDSTLIKSLEEADIHRAISKTLFGLTDADLDAMSEEERTIKRRAAKTIAFGMIYGRSPASIAPQLNVSTGEAEAYVSKFFRMMPKVKEYINRQHALVMKDREVTTIFGRKRRFPLISDNSHAGEIRRQAVNFPVQSAVSDMTLLANMRIIERIDELGIQCRVWPHVHDGFYFQVESDRVDEAVQITREEMANVPFETRVPFICEIQTGPNWGELKDA